VDLVVGICLPELEMEVVLVRVLGVEAVVVVIEGVSKVVVAKEVSAANLGDIAIPHLLALQDDNVLEIIEVPKKRNCVGFEKWTGSTGLEWIVGKVQVTVLGGADLEDVGFVFLSILQFHWRYLFLFPRSEPLEDFFVVHFQPLLEVDAVLVEVLDGLDVREALVVEIKVLVWLQLRQMFSLCLL
jgi:hypothetical protein